MEVSMNLKTIIALAIAGAFAMPVAAQTSSGTDKHKSEAGGTAPGGFAGIDKNSDGYISRDEAKDAAWSNRFTELDKDNDGRLSRSEFDALGTTAAGASGRDASSPSTTGGMGGSAGPGGTQSGSSTSGVGDKPGQKQ
jgi:hypothetical protein